MWKFRTVRADEVEIDPTQEQFFNTEDVDRTDALVRETIQNSLDAARAESNSPVRVRFRFATDGSRLTPTESSRYLGDLLPHLSAANVDAGVSLSEPLDYLLVEDFGTTGLNGETGSGQAAQLGKLHGVKSNFLNFWRRIGTTQKEFGERGRWGLGKTVYPNSSRLRAFFGFTVRDDDARRLLMGEAIVKTHSLEGSLYSPYGFYAEFEENGFQNAIEDPQLVEAFRSSFGLTRGNATGLSVAIPAPHEEIQPKGIITAAIRHYFHPILAGTLIVEVEGTGLSELIDAHTIQDVNSRFGNKDEIPDKLLSFTRATLAPDRTTIELNAGDKPAQRLGSDLFGPSLQELQARYAKGEIIGVTVHLGIHPKGNPAASTSFRLFVQRDDNLERGLDFYIRSGIAVSGIHQLGNRPVLGLLVADDELISRFLGDAENPAHTQWNERLDSFKAKYERRPVALLRFVKTSLRSLVEILATAPEGKQRNLLRDLFHVDMPASDELPADEPPPTRKKADTPIPAIRNQEPSPFRLTRLTDGFSITGNPTASARPARGRVRVAYDIVRGSPFRRYDPRDFNLALPPIKIEAVEARCDPKANQLEFEAQSNDFRISVTGFDAHRDLVIRITENKRGLTDDQAL